MMKKKGNLIKLFPMIGMVIIVAGMIVSFLKIDKIQLEIKSGDFVIVSPYSIQIADDSFFNYYGINNPKDSVLYRYDDEESGNLNLKFLIDKDKAEFESFPIEGKAILDRNKLPKFVPQKSTIPSGDYITMRTFDMLKKKVNVIQDTHIKDYYVYIKSANTDQIAQLLDKEERVVVSDQMSESSIFSNWYKFMILGTVCLLVLAVLEIVIIVKRKKVS